VPGDACTIVELLAAILGGPQPIETADALLAHFRGRWLTCSAPGTDRQHPRHRPANAARIKAAPELGLRLTLNADEAPRSTARRTPPPWCSTKWVPWSRNTTHHIADAPTVIEIEEVYHGNLNSTQVRG
jgi:hypothetical protein